MRPEHPSRITDSVGRDHPRHRRTDAGTGALRIAGWCARVLAAALLLGPSLAHAQTGRGRFDGTWDVVLSCSRADDGASGYVFRFAATVRGSVLHAEKGTPGQPGTLVLNGTIQPDGSAMLMADGHTGNPNYAVGRVAQATPYSYRMQARFDDQRGTGTRLDTRPCTASFARQ